MDNSNSSTVYLLLMKHTEERRKWFWSGKISTKKIKTVQ